MLLGQNCCRKGVKGSQGPVGNTGLTGSTGFSGVTGPTGGSAATPNMLWFSPGATGVGTDVSSVIGFGSFLDTTSETIDQISDTLNVVCTRLGFLSHLEVAVTSNPDVVDMGFFVRHSADCNATWADSIFLVVDGGATGCFQETALTQDVDQNDRFTLAVVPQDLGGSSTIVFSAGLRYT